MDFSDLLSLISVLFSLVTGAYVLYGKLIGIWKWIFVLLIFSVFAILGIAFWTHRVDVWRQLHCDWAVSSSLGDIQLKLTIPPSVYTENTRLTKAIEDAVLEPITSVYVLYGPPETGKTTAAHHVLHNLYSAGNISVLYLPAQDYVKRLSNLNFVPPQSIERWIADEIGCRPQAPMCSSIENLFLGPRNPRVVLFLDQFELVMRNTPLDILQTMISATAIMARGSQQGFTVLLITSNLTASQEILSWNGGMKFRSVMRDKTPFVWTAEELLLLVNRYVDVGEISLSPKQRHELEETINVQKITSVGQLLDYITYQNLRVREPKRVVDTKAKTDL